MGTLSAYEVAQISYPEYLSTIYFLLDLYEKSKKSLKNLLAKVEENTKQKLLHEGSQRGHSVSGHKSNMSQG